MNILFIEKACDGTIGGSHTCLYNLARSLDKDKYTLWVALYQQNSYVEKMRRIGVEVILLHRNPLWGGIPVIRKVRNWYRLVYRHRLELSQIISSHHIELLIINNSIAGGQDYVHVAKKFHIPIMAYERGYISYRRSDIALSHKISQSIAVSRAIQCNMLQQGFSLATRVIYDGIPLPNGASSKQDQNSTDIKQKIGIPANSIVIGIVGNIRHWKGQEYFVKAFLALGKKYGNLYGLVIGGHGAEDSAYMKHLECLSRGSDTGKRLLYLGFRDDVSDLLRILDVFIHASIEPEPFGMVILEAMTNKVPVIATNIGGPVEILSNGECGLLVPPRNYRAIIDGVERYLNNKMFRDEMIERAYQRIQNEFDLRKTINFINDLIQEVVCRYRI